MNKNALWNLSYGVYIVSVWDKERPTGCVVNCAMQITADPETVAISISHDNYTNQCIEKTGKFAITVLPQNTDPSIIGTFGFKTGKDVNKFDSVGYEIKNDMPVVKDGCAYLICDVINKMETDTHTVFLGKVLDVDFITQEEPMTYSYYHKVIKGRSPKNAPTYIAPKGSQEVTPPEKRATYVCGICGYEYTGDVPFEDLPEDYTCPICDQPKSEFIKKE
ncbi:MAG TPA: flavin reductase [Clostridium sp.]|mgnify:CR=1 FL=1|uniref:Flavin reductase n=2 Tax=Acetivibrio mesophilus TaxID=2487273 RepID=A0A4Q0I2D4_9FIRM|nr:flavin reductase [Acetivibrio mesophilus]ODM27914.1 flavin reductase [Clostridium sp. Bc-iso-3]RXE57857.1 flavin reductase [Acetivibrio mesophilus]HHV29010.1 flavin reductase [Clostridium sp.]